MAGLTLVFGCVILDPAVYSAGACASATSQTPNLKVSRVQVRYLPKAKVCNSERQDYYHNVGCREEKLTLGDWNRDCPNPP